MHDTPSIFDVTRDSFAALVLDNSFNVPVLVDFWAAWCQPCQMLTPLLKRLVEDYQGAVLLAKVNADREPALAAQFGVRGLPTVKIFHNGQVVDELIGLQPEAVYREVLERYRVPASDRLVAQAEAAWQQGNRKKALRWLREAQAQEPDNVQIKFALADKLLASGEVDTASDILHGLPYEVRMEPPASGLLARLEFLEQVKDAPATASLEKTVQEHPEDCGLRRQLGARKVLEGDFEAALQQFLEILRRDPKFDDEAGRKGLLAIFNILGDAHPLVSTYRRRMFTLLH